MFYVLRTRLYKCRYTQHIMPRTHTLGSYIIIIILYYSGSDINISFLFSLSLRYTPTFASALNFWARV